MKRFISILFALVLVASFSLVTAAPAGAQTADGDVTIVVQDQAGTPIEDATATLLFYGGGKGGYSMDGRLTDATGSATFTAAEIATWLTANLYDPSIQIYVQPGAKVETDTAYGKVRTVDPVDGFPIIPYNVLGAPLEPKPAMSFTYNMIMMSTEPVQTVWDDPSNDFTVTATLADSLSVTPDVTKLRLIRNLVGAQPPAAGGSDDDWYMWNGTAYERWKGIATVEATAIGASISASFSQDIFSDWLVGNKIVVRPEFGVNRIVDSVPCIDDYYAVDILRPSSYIHPAQIDDTDLFYPTIQDAIDAADPGDTILVAAGTYNENIVVNKSLTLEAASSPIIDGEGTLTNPAIHVQAASVTVQGFVIQNFIATGADKAGDIGAILVEGDNAKILDNIVRNITCTGTEGDCPAGLGIDVSANDVEVKGNEVYDISSIGIRVRARFENPEIQKTGILLEGNTVHDTGNSGVLVVGYVTGITIRGGNEIYDSLAPTPYSLLMVPFSTHAPSDVLIEGNTIYNGYGNICLGGVTNITITGNTIYGAIPHYSDPENIKGKNIYIREWGGFLTTDVTITNNSITGAEGSGVNIKYTDAAGASTMASTTTINFNNISGNSDYGVLNEIATNVNANMNYWGNASGPDGAQDFTGPETYTGLLPGTGDRVSANVRCFPWLTRPFGTVLEDDIAYFGISSPAKKGWNIVSAPLALDAHVTAGGFAANTWGGLLNLGKKAESDDYALKLHYTLVGEGKVYTPIYWYDSDPASADFGWRPANELTKVNPVDAFYIRMKESDSIPILWSPDFSVPSKKLYHGWNLVGCAYMDMMFQAEGQHLETALATIETVSSPAGDVKGYAQVVSPPVNQMSWIFIPPDTYIPSDAEGVMLIGRGYWVFMANPGTLAGLTFTPISLGGP